MLIFFVRALCLYLVVCTVIRLMGKREIGQLQPLEFVLALLAADLVNAPMGDARVPLLFGLVPVSALLFAHLCISFLSMKSRKIRDFINGKPVIVIQDGTLQESAMRISRYNITDLLEQLRSKGVFSVTDVSYAILETNGTLSVFPRPENSPVTAKDMKIHVQPAQPSYTLIYDGEINYQNLYELGYSRNWLQQIMADRGFHDARQIFFASIQDDTIYMQAKQTLGATT